MPEILRVETGAADRPLADRVELHPGQTADEGLCAEAELRIEADDGLTSTEEQLVDIDIDVDVDVPSGVVQPDSLSDVEDSAQRFGDLRPTGVHLSTPGAEIEDASIREVPGRRVPVDVRQILGDRIEQLDGALRPRRLDLVGVTGRGVRAGTRHAHQPQSDRRSEREAGADLHRHNSSRGDPATPRQSPKVLPQRTDGHAVPALPPNPRPDGPR